MGRAARPLSARNRLHLVFRSNYSLLRSPRRYRLIRAVIQIYASKFYVHVEQVSVQGNHIHLLVRTRRRTNFLAFFRVVAGQIPQRLEKIGLFEYAHRVTDTPRVKEKLRFWKHRPFTRIVRGLRDHSNVRDYIQLNELEARGVVKYRKARLRGLNYAERWRLLWSSA